MKQLLPVLGAFVVPQVVDTKPVRRHCTLFALALLLALASQTQAQLVCATNNGAITITGYSGAGGDVNIPSSIGGLPVLAIGEWAFARSVTVTNLTIPEGVTSIGSSALSECTKLLGVRLPNSLTNIEQQAFDGCSSLNSLSIGANVGNIGWFAFYRCQSLEAINVDPMNPAYASLDGILYNKERTTLIVCPGGYSGSCSVPVGVTDIVAEAFDGCVWLTSVTIPSTVTNLPPTFMGATNLVAINVAIGNPRFCSRDGILFGTAPPYWALLRCPEGRAGDFIVPVTALYIESDAFRNCAKLTSITILPQTVASVGDSTFSGCTGLTNVSLGEGVWVIGNYAFADCTNLTSITLPRSVERVYLPFPDCRSLTAINVAPGSSSFTSVDGVLFDYAQTTLIELPGARGGYYQVPDGVLNISYGAFAACARLTRITVPATVTNIGGAAFQGCVNVTNIDIAAGITRIGAAMFDHCTNLSSLTLPGTVLNIGEFAFGFCSSLPTMSLPTSLQNIERWSFWGSGLTNITIPAAVTNIDSAAFAACDSLRSLNVDANNASYSSIDGVLFDKSGASLLQCPARKPGSYVIPGGVSTLAESAFGYCVDLTRITVPSSVATMGDYAFESCTNLRGVYFYGNAPLVGAAPFIDDPYVVVYYLSGTTGWGPDFGGRPTALWLPEVDFTPGSLGVHNNEFGFSINWRTGKSVVIDACTDLANPSWSALSTNTVGLDGTTIFRDPYWTTSPSRFYRVRMEE